MAHDPGRTRSLLLSAAVREFSEHGYAGARVDRICSAAGVNKERLYSYFGNKRSLLETVLAHQLASALDATPVRGAGSAAATQFATAYFDACLAATDLPRLVTWEGLELQTPIDVDDRRTRACTKVEELRAALPEATREQTEDLFLTIVTLCHGWFTGPNLGRIIAGDETNHSRRRDAIAATAASIAEIYVRAQPHHS
jgi:AcrR family transcriptional regulator